MRFELNPFNWGREGRQAIRAAQAESERLGKRRAEIQMHLAIETRERGGRQPIDRTRLMAQTALVNEVVQQAYMLGAATGADLQEAHHDALKDAHAKGKDAAHADLTQAKALLGPTPDASFNGNGHAPLRGYERRNHN